MSIKEQFEKTDKLYHFTTFDKAMLILESKCLRFGRLSNMNDIHESAKMVFADGERNVDKFPSDKLETFYEEIYKHRQISLTAEGEPGDKEGFDLHQMWGLYANKGEGVCLVFDKGELLRLADIQNVHHERVSYDNSKTLESFSVTHSDTLDDISSEVEKHLSEIFFHKRNEWEHEQEYKLTKRCPNPNKEEYLRYGDSLKFIIMSSKLCGVDEIRYHKQINKLNEYAFPVLVYGNGLLDYSLDTSGGEETIWKAEDGYDILNLISMRKRYSKEELTKFSNEELIEKTRNRAVDIHFNDGRWTQLCVNDLQGFDSQKFFYYTITGIKIEIQNIDYIEVISSF